MASDVVRNTGSSGLRCSEGASFRLYAAHKTSRDFLRVSSILQAANKAAAAASYIILVGVQGCEGNTYRPTIFTLRIHETKFVKVDACCVVCSNGSS